MLALLIFWLAMSVITHQILHYRVVKGVGMDPHDRQWTIGDSTQAMFMMLCGAWIVYLIYIVTREIDQWDWPSKPSKF